MKTLRRQARGYALQLLYQVEIGQSSDTQARETFWEKSKASKKARAFAAELVERTLRHREELDRELTAVLEEWRLERLPVVVRNVLRLAACELRVVGTEPHPVVINEAVELTRTFMDEESAKFVNGVLERLRRKNEPPPSTQAMHSV